MPSSARTAARSSRLTPTGPRMSSASATGKVVAMMTASDTDAFIAAFSPDGKRVVVGYPIRDRTGVGCRHETPADDAGRARRLLSVAAQFSPDGQEVVTGSGDRQPSGSGMRNRVNCGNRYLTIPPRQRQSLPPRRPGRVHRQTGSSPVTPNCNAFLFTANRHSSQQAVERRAASGHGGLEPCRYQRSFPPGRKVPVQLRHAVGSSLTPWPPLRHPLTSNSQTTAPSHKPGRVAHSHRDRLAWRRVSRYRCETRIQGRLLRTLNASNPMEDARVQPQPGSSSSAPTTNRPGGGLEQARPGTPTLLGAPRSRPHQHLLQPEGKRVLDRIGQAVA